MSLKNPVLTPRQEVKGSPDGLLLPDAFVADLNSFFSGKLRLSNQKYVHWLNMLLKTAVGGSGQF